MMGLCLLLMICRFFIFKTMSKPFSISEKRMILAFFSSIFKLLDIFNFREFRIDSSYPLGSFYFYYSLDMLITSFFTSSNTASSFLVVDYKLNVAYRELALMCKKGRDRKSMIGISMVTRSIKEDERRKFTLLKPHSWSIASSFKLMFFRSMVPPQREKSKRSRFVMYCLRVLWIALCIIF